MWGSLIPVTGFPLLVGKAVKWVPAEQCEHIAAGSAAHTACLHVQTINAYSWFWMVRLLDDACTFIYCLFVCLFVSQSQSSTTADLMSGAAGNKQIGGVVGILGFAVLALLVHPQVRSSFIS
eukprot:COSAG01_NODE_20983_length_923_cov_21.446184_2_plen_122_part_00